MIRRLVLFISLILLTSSSAIEDCVDCYANIITSTDGHTIEDIRMSDSDSIAVSNEGLIAGTGVASDPYVIEKMNLRDLPANGLMIRDIEAYLLLKDFTFENLGKGNHSSLPVGIGTQCAKNVMVENCTAYSGESFRFSFSENITIRNSTGRNIYLEGIKNGLIDCCNADCIMIKGKMSPFYSYKLFDPLYNIFNDTLVNQRNDKMAVSQNCIIKDCHRVKEIDIFDAQDCIVENSSMHSVGLWMMNANNITFSNISAVNAALSMDWCKETNFENATLINSSISLSGSGPEDYSIAFKNSTVDGRPIYYYENQSGLAVKNLSAGYVWMVNCPRSRLDGIEALGIFIINSDGVVISNSNIGRTGVNLAFSNDCQIFGNVLANQEYEDDIVQHALCRNNTASGNTAVKEIKNLSMDFALFKKIA